MLISFIGRIIGIPWARRLLWKGWYQYLSRKFAGEHWSFMNYGYVILDPSEPAPDLELDDESDRLCIQLYHKLIKAAEPEGKDILEVGSGRGGGASYVARYHRPRSMVGIDFSREAVTLATRRFASANLRFIEGDASQLPIEDASFDVVLNVESSHCYPSRAVFFSEVHRVLRPEGRFQYADLFTPHELPQTRSELAATGMTILSEQQITPNVLASLDQSHEVKSVYIATTMPGKLEQIFGSFAGVKGSPVYNAFKSGELVYAAFSIQRD